MCTNTIYIIHLRRHLYIQKFISTCSAGGEESWCARNWVRTSPKNLRRRNHTGKRNDFFFFENLFRRKNEKEKLDQTNAIILLLLYEIFAPFMLYNSDDLICKILISTFLKCKFRVFIRKDNITDYRDIK